MDFAPIFFKFATLFAVQGLYAPPGGTLALFGSVPLWSTQPLNCASGIIHKKDSIQ